MECVWDIWDIWGMVMIIDLLIIVYFLNGRCITWNLLWRICQKCLGGLIRRTPELMA